MVPNKGSPWIFKNYGPATQRKSKNDKIESRVSEMWCDSYKTIVDVCQQYGDKDSDYEHLSAINPALGAHNAKKRAHMDMADSAATAGLPQIFRTGWDVKMAHTLFDYIVGTKKMDTQAGKKMAGWCVQYSPNEIIFGGYPPEPRDLTTQPEKFNTFVNILFADVDGMEKRVLQLLAMTVLLRYESVLEHIKKEPFGKYEIATEHPFVAAVETAREGSGVSCSVFKSWQKDANDKFLARNMPALPLDRIPDGEDVFQVDARCIIASQHALARQRQSDHGEFCCVLFVLIM
jgi:hypothetical protein